MKNKILYLSHTTNIKNLKSILLSRELYTPFKLSYKSIEPLGYNTGGSKKKYPLLVDEKDADGFPGVYMSLIDKNYMTQLDNLKFKKDEVQMIFCPDILKRGDFHYNKTDSNGFINKNLTFLTLDDILEYIELNNDKLNEVVFHNPVSLNYLKEIWVDTEDKKYKVEKILDESKTSINLDISINLHTK